jgi:hypothetical protein
MAPQAARRAEGQAEAGVKESELLPRPDVVLDSESGVRARLDDCTTAVEERLKASLARDRLRQWAKGSVRSSMGADIQILLAEVDDLNRRLRSATHAMQKAVSAIDNEQYHARVRAAKSHLENELEGLVHEFGLEG